ncbi:MAG: TonB-dependent receptor [Bacteroidales bacterium]
MRYLKGYFLLFLLTFAFFPIIHAQSLSISVKDGKRLPLPGASVSLIQLPDSVHSNSFTNGNGIAVFDKAAQGMYFVRVSHISYQAVEKTIVVKEGRWEFDFLLTDKVSELDAITVTARRPLITQEDDKMIIDPEPIANTSTNTLEVLEATPGLFVDQDGGIYLNSATPAVVYINGREQKMSNQDINTILRSLPPGSVQRIEVLRTPSTKYDAASSGGIINIVLKKGVKIGRFGSVNGGMNQGKYGNRYAGFTINNSSDKSTMYLNTNFGFNDMLEEINATRVMQPDTFLVQAANTRNKNNNSYVGYGINYDLKERLSLSYDGRLSLSGRTSAGDNSNIIQTSELEKLLQSDNTVASENQFVSIQQDLGLNWKPDTTGNEWDTKFSYSFNHSSGTQENTTEYLFPFPYSLIGLGDNIQVRHFIQFQSDLTWQLPYSIKLETGGKSAWQEYDSDADFFSIENAGIKEPDMLRTNTFRYSERINAAYAQASRKLPGDFLLKTGVRMEHTWMEGRQQRPADTSFVVNRADWFPYVYLSRKVFSMGDFELLGYLIYRKTINRPGYQSLNPAVRFIDQFMYETGNPALKPQFTENVEMNISFNDFPVFAIGRNYTTDIFTPVVYRDDSPEKSAIRTWDNIGKSYETYLRGLVGIPPGKRYFFALGAQYNLNEYNGLYENQPLNYTRGSWRFFTFHSLKLFKETRLTANGFLMHNGNYNFYELKTFGMLNIGLHQTFFKKKLQVTLNARDLLGTMVTAFELNQGSISAFGDRYADTRRFGINIRYNFGIRTKEEKREMFPMEEGGID